jgi:hypothetical protein
MEQMGLHQIKKPLQNKRTESRLKRLHTEWEKIFAIYTFYKGLISRTYRELKNSIYKESTHQ